MEQNQLFFLNYKHQLLSGFCEKRSCERQITIIRKKLQREMRAEEREKKINVLVGRVYTCWISQAICMFA
jgi:hypothetical protein